MDFLLEKKSDLVAIANAVRLKTGRTRDLYIPDGSLKKAIESIATAKEADIKKSEIASQLILPNTLGYNVDSLTIYGNTDEEGNSVGSVSGAQNVRIIVNSNGLNLIDLNPITSGESSGVSYTVLEDGSIKLSGETTAGFGLTLRLKNPFEMKAGVSYAWGGWYGTAPASYNALFRLRGSSDANLGQVQTLNAYATITPSSDVTVSNLYFYINSGKTVDCTLKPFLRYSEYATYDYEPYVEPKTINYGMDKPLRSVGETYDIAVISGEIMNVTRKISDNFEVLDTPILDQYGILSPPPTLGSPNNPATTILSVSGVKPGGMIAEYYAKEGEL